jgi:hypothetical protein
LRVDGGGEAVCVPLWPGARVQKPP